MTIWRRLDRKVLAAIFLLVATTMALPLAAAELEIAGVQIGFGGRYKVGRWTPVVVQISGGDEAVAGRLELETLDGDGEPVVYAADDQTPPTAVAAGGRAVARGFIKSGRADADLKVRFVDGETTLAAAEFSCSPQPNERQIPYPLNSMTRLVVILGGDPGVAEREEDDDPTTFDPQAVYAAQLDTAELLDDLPDRWYGYDGVDAVIATTAGGADLYRSLSGTARLTALEHYVRAGGKLILSAASQADEVFRAEHPLAQFTPGRLEGVVRLPSSTNLEAFVQSRSPLNLGSLEAADRPPVAKLAAVRGAVQTFEGADRNELPLVVRSPLGFGEVAFVALDLESPPLRDWPGSRRLTAKLLQASTTPLVAADETQTVSGKGNLQDYGFNDFAGMLRASLETFEGVEPTSFTLVAVLIGVYILLIGPLDYLLVHRVLRRPELTWVTFPLAAVAFCVLAYYLAFHLKGRELRLNQIDVVDLDAASGRLRGLSLWNVFSPRPEQLDLRIDPSPTAGDLAEVASTASWYGTPGEVFNGLDSYSGSRLFGRSYQIEPASGRIAAATVQTWNTKAFAAEWSARWAAEAGELTEQAGRAAHVRGWVANPFDLPLTECRLMYGQRVYRLGEMDPGERREVDVSGSDVALRTLLQERTFLVTGAGDAPTPVDLGSTDPFYILDKMLFHEAIDGVAYTGVYNRYFARMDATQLMENGRAIFVGRSLSPATVVRDGEAALADRAGAARSHTVVRIVLPVAPVAAE